MTTFPADAYGNLIPVATPVYGASLEVATTLGGGTAMNINPTAASALITIQAITADCYYKTGTSGVGVPTAVDGFIFAGQSKDIVIPNTHTHVRMVGRSAGGFARAEYIG